jgi:hypothetical protein
MKKNLIVLALVLIMITAVSTSVAAQDKPIQLSLFAPVQLFNENTSITGIRLSLLYGRNTSVTGLDWGLVNHCTGGKSMGVQFGVVGLVDGDFVGLQDNWVNSVKGDFQGFQWGLVNYANHANGLQLGFVNYAVTMKGLQIGLINVIKQGGQFPIFPIVNWSF